MTIDADLLSKITAIDMSGKALRAVLRVLSEHEAPASPAAIRKRRQRDRERDNSVTCHAPVTGQSQDMSRSLPPPLPLPPAPPSPTPPPTGDQSCGRVRTREWPTREQAQAYAATVLITAEEAEAYWLAREASDWQRGSGGGGLTPVGNWRADLQSYVRGERQRKAEAAARSKRFGPQSKTEFDLQPAEQPPEPTNAKPF